MQKSNLRKVGGCTAVVIGDWVTRLVGVDPSLGHKPVSILAPESWRAVDGVRAEDEPCSFRHVLARDCGVANSFTDGDGNGGEETKDFLADAVE